MKQQQTQESVERASRSFGLVTLSLLILLTAIWIGFQGHQFASPATHKLSPLQDSAGLARFRADAWYLPNEPLLGFVAIPAGPFLMGSDPAVDAFAFENERWSVNSNQGTVDLPTFYISRYEVTVAQFRAFVAATNYKVDDQALRAPGEHPVTNISWTDALAYSRWLETMFKQSSLTPPQLSRLLSDGWRISLPNEAQWEKAARGQDGRVYPWGNAPNSERANFHGPGPMPVGSLQCAECPYGLADMSGNVWELTRSVDRPYPFDPTNERGDLQADALFVMRGGSFADAENNVRAAIRGGVDPGARRAFIGFRIVLARFD